MANNANKDRKMSAAGYDALRLREGVVMHHYNDAPKNGNCTYGAGTLVHYGPCEADELNKPVPAEMVNSSLKQRVEEAERIVRSIVSNQELTQEQFDAAVSFAYNSKVRNSRATLRYANNGDMKAVANHMLQNVYISQRDRHGNAVGKTQFSHGLFRRRQSEAAPFQKQQGAR